MIVLESVSKRFKGGNFGVRDLSLTLRGGVVGLLGPNGAGKSTLMQMIATGGHGATYKAPLLAPRHAGGVTGGHVHA